MGGFLAELKRRRVFHTAGIYAVAALGASEGTQIVVGQLGLPDGIATGVVVAALVGFPVALVLAWFFEVRLEEGAEAPAGGTDAESPAVPVRRRWGVVATGVIGVVAVATAFVLTRPGGLSGALLQEGAPVVVAEFDAPDGDAELGAVVATALRTDLAHSDWITVVSRASVESALDRMGEERTAPVTAEVAHEIAVRDGYPAVIEGEVQAVGSAWVISARVVEVATGEVLTTAREKAAGDDSLVDAIDRVSATIRDAAGESLAAVEATTPLPQLTTRSVAALRALERARDPGAPIWALYEEALAADSTFVLPKLFMVLDQRLHGRALSLADAVRRVRALYEERDRLTPGERAQLLWHFHWIAEGNYAAADEAIRDYLDGRPHERSAYLWMLVLGAMRVSEWEEAVDILHELRKIDGELFPGMYWNLIGSLTMMGRDAEADAELERRPNGNISGRLALVREDWDRMEGALSDPDAVLNEVEPYLIPMYVALARGQLDEHARATEALREVWARTQDDLAGLPDFRSVVDLVLRGDTARALARPPIRLIPDNDLGHALFLAWADRPAEARAVLAEFDMIEDSILHDVTRWRREAVEARVLLAEGRPEETVRRLRGMEASLHTFLDRSPCRACYLLTLGQAFDALEMPDSAAVAYERYLAEGRWMFDSGRHFRVPWLGPVHERLGQLHEELGRPEKAIPHYRKLVTDWSEADPVLQPRVRAAREALERLGGDPGGG